MLFDIRTESTIRTICDGLLTAENMKDHAVYIAFDLRVDTDTTNYDQRSVAVGIHLLRFYGSIIGAADRDFLMSTFDADRNWEYISGHSSCWADSTMHYMNSIVQDIINNKDNSKYTEPYKDDNLSYGEKWDANMIIQAVNLVKKNEFKGIVYDDRNGGKRELCPKWMK